MEQNTKTLVNEEQAQAFAQSQYQEIILETGEKVFDHAQGVVDIIREIRYDKELIAAAYLYYIPVILAKESEKVLTENFGASVAGLVNDLAQIDKLSHRARSSSEEANASRQAESLRKMLLAMCDDLRVVLLKLASRLQTLRWLAKIKSPDCASYGEETLALYAPLANRLGIWQIKWELEDLSLRFTRPEEYRDIAHQLDESREERLEFMQWAVSRCEELLKKANITAKISGRPKHIYSIWKKMQRKHLDFKDLYDVRAIRVIVSTVEECYEVLSIIHENLPIISKEFDDYIACPKPNGYQSLHTVVTDQSGRPIEVQIRTQGMHDFAELGVAAHWRYKESGNSLGATSAEEQRVAWLRQLLAWRTEVEGTPAEDEHEQVAQVVDDRIYALTPQGRVVELPAGATPVDFAYHVHTQLGHRMRGAKVDEKMVPLNTVLKTGQTVEIIVAKEGRPSRDWLNPELGFTASPRTRNKVRQWFNAQQAQQLQEQGREKLDKELARLGKTATKLDVLSKRMGFETTEDFFVAIGREEVTPTAIAQAVVPPKIEEKQAPEVLIREAKKEKQNGVLVVGVDSLMTQLAQCCHPVPPDEIVGYVTRGRGVSIHRADCPNIKNLSNIEAERLIEVSWGNQVGGVYSAEVLIVATDRESLLRDLSELFLKDKHAVTGLNTQRVKGDVRFHFSLEIASIENLKKTLQGIRELRGVLSARRL